MKQAGYATGCFGKWHNGAHYPHNPSGKGTNGWANDWITNWTDTDAYAWWPLKVVEPGRFEITLMYVCSQENLGTVGDCVKWADFA